MSENTSNNEQQEISTYRKKPVVIKAIQLREDNIKKVYEFIHGAGSIKTDSRIAEDRWQDYENIVRQEGLRLKTLESDGETQVADIGDWIIKGVEGEYYPCKPQIFEKTYELAVNGSGKAKASEVRVNALVKCTRQSYEL